MTGILGIKAYRCLNNSRFVLVILAILRTAMIILCILDLTDYRASRRLSGEYFSPLDPFFWYKQTLKFLQTLYRKLYAADEFEHHAHYHHLTGGGVGLHLLLLQVHLFILAVNVLMFSSHIRGMEGIPLVN